MSETRYVLIRDDDCHWYVCPADRRKDAHKWFSDYAGWTEDDSAMNPGDCPEWLVSVGGSPGLVEFTGYQIKGS